jgi:hypothetical protein
MTSLTFKEQFPYLSDGEVKMLKRLIEKCVPIKIAETYIHKQRLVGLKSLGIEDHDNYQEITIDKWVGYNLCIDEFNNNLERLLK